MPPIPEPLRSHPFLAGLEPQYLDLLASWASDVTFPDGTFLFREDQPAENFYLIRSGTVVLEISVPGRGPVIMQTLSAGDVAGFSWLLEPHLWEFDGRAVGQVTAIEMDGVQLRLKCEEEARLGFELMRRFARLAVSRLQAARMQILDVYGHAGAG